jgi:predicted metalloprotease
MSAFENMSQRRPPQNKNAILSINYGIRKIRVTAGNQLKTQGLGEPVYALRHPMGHLVCSNALYFLILAL